jgi:integrase/recombinase XerD
MYGINNFNAKTTHSGDRQMKQARLLTDAERKRLAAVIDSRRHAVRNHTAVALSFYAGLRACEIAALRVGDVFDEAGAVRDTIYLSAAQTKGNTGNTVFVNKRLAAALKRYAAAYPKRIAQPNAPIMYSGKGGGFTAQTVVNLFQHLYRAAGIAGASSHSGRRQFITELADKGVSARLVQAAARHRSLAVTMRYIDVSENKLRAAVELVSY